MKIVSMVTLIVSAIFLSVIGFGDPKETKVNNKLVIAVVNDDEGSNFNNSKAHFGAELLSGLANEKKYTWKETSHQVADLGVQSGEFPIAIYIPTNFTEKAIAINTESPDKALVDFKINLDNEYFDTHSTAEFITEFEQYTNTALSEMYYELVFESLSSAKSQLASVTNEQDKLNTLFSDDIHSNAEVNQNNIDAMIEGGLQNYEDNKLILSETEQLSTPFEQMQKEYINMDTANQDFRDSYQEYGENLTNFSNAKQSLNELSAASKENISLLRNRIEILHDGLQSEVEKISPQCSTTGTGNDTVETCSKNYSEMYLNSVAKQLNILDENLPISEANILGAYSTRADRSKDQIKYFLGENYSENTKVSEVIKALEAKESDLQAYRNLVSKTDLYRDLRNLSQEVIGNNFDELYKGNLNPIINDYLKEIPTSMIKLDNHTESFMKNVAVVESYRVKEQVIFNNESGYLNYDAVWQMPKGGLEAGLYPIELLYQKDDETIDFNAEIVTKKGQDYRITKTSENGETKYQIRLLRKFTAAEFIDLEFKLYSESGTEIKIYDSAKIVLKLENTNIPEIETPEVPGDTENPIDGEKIRLNEPVDNDDKEPVFIVQPFKLVHSLEKKDDLNVLSHLKIDTNIQFSGTIIPKIEQGLYSNQKLVSGSEMISKIDQLVDEISTKIYITILNNFKENLVESEKNMILMTDSAAQFEIMYGKLVDLDSVIMDIKDSQIKLSKVVKADQASVEDEPTFQSVVGEIEIFSLENKNHDKELSELQKSVREGTLVLDENVRNSHDILVSIDDFPTLLSDYEQQIRMLSESFEETQRISNESKAANDAYTLGISNYNAQSNEFSNNSDSYRKEIESIFSESVINGKVNEDLMKFLTSPVEVRNQTLSNNVSHEEKAIVYPFVVIIITSIISIIIGNIFAMSDRKNKQGIKVLIPILASIVVSFIIALISGSKVGLSIESQALWTLEIMAMSLLVMSITHVVGYYTNTFGLIVSLLLVMMYILMNGAVLANIKQPLWVESIKPISLLSWFEPALRALIMKVSFNPVALILLSLLGVAAIYLLTILPRKMKNKNEVSLETE